MLQALGAVAIVNHLQALESVRGVWVCFFWGETRCAWFPPPFVVLVPTAPGELG